MSNYTQSTFFSPKDSLTPGDPLKKIKGTEVDAELAAITTAVASKADNTGPTSSLTALTAPGADRLVFWDHSATAYDWLNAVGSNSGLSIAGTAMVVDITGLTAEGALAGAHSFMIHNGTALRKVTVSQIPHNSLAGYEGNRHVDHSTLVFTAGDGLSGGGALTGPLTVHFSPVELTVKGAPTTGDYIVIADNAVGGTPPKVAQLSAMMPAIQGAIVALPIANGGTSSSNAAAARTALGLQIGLNVATYSARTNFLETMSVADGVFIVGDGTGLVTESGATARASLGLGTMATRNVTVSTAAPSGGADDDLWFVREA